jgi:hypothetical protein
MEGFIVLVIVAAGMSVLGALANVFGVDSRFDDLNDWARDAAR